MVEALEVPLTPFTHPVPGRGGYWVNPPPKNLPPSRTTPVPNFIWIHPGVWISIEKKHIDRHTLIALYVLDLITLITSKLW